MINVTCNGISREFKNRERITVYDFLLENGYDFSAPCSGNHTCGKCKCKITGEISPITEDESLLLTENEIKGSVRLSCFTYIEGDCNIEITAPYKQQILSEFKTKISGRSSFGGKYGICIDIGTTTVAMYLYDIKSKEQLQVITFLNPQVKFGSDVISRIEYTKENGTNQLSDCIIDAIRNAIYRFKVPCEEIEGAVITGNTVMLHLLCGYDVLPIASYPYTTISLFGEYNSKLPKLLPFKKVYLCRCLSSYVGADITCGILSTELYKNDLCLLVDIGTNGEMALCKDGKLYICATAAGPAFEGCGLSCGCSAIPGAISKVYEKDGIIAYDTIEGKDAVGICGSGIIDAISVLRKCNIIDFSGRIESGEYIFRNSNIKITAEDIRKIQLAKSAICAGIHSLCHASNCRAEDIKTLYIAGGFGNYLNIKSACDIGLIPSCLYDKAVFVGNAAAAGAAHILLDDNAFSKEKETANNIIDIDLSTNGFFMEKYIDCMFFGNEE